MTLWKFILDQRKQRMNKCPFADNWENQEGWFFIGGKLVCGDWDDLCTLCMKHDGTDDIGIIVVSKVREDKT